MKKDIELELRAEIASEHYASLLKRLKKEAVLISSTERLSVMYFGKIGEAALDIRVRITNGKSEIALKKGALHASDRIEAIVPIHNNQFMDMAKLYAAFGFKAEVAERKTYNFQFPGKVTFSLVQAKDIAYVEIEKMSSAATVRTNEKDLRLLADRYDLQIIETEKDFDALCDKLSERTDWAFNNTPSQQRKLKNILRRYTK